jgi:hypothetical protein
MRAPTSLLALLAVVASLVLLPGGGAAAGSETADDGAMFTADVDTAAPGASSATCPRVDEGDVGTWTRRPAPTTPSGADAITAHAVDPRDPTRHVISDGISILVTVDDGCAWEEVFTLPEAAGPDLPASAATDRIFDLAVHPTHPERLWAVVAVGQTVAEDLDRAGLFTPAARERRDATATLVLRSPDGGETWLPPSVPPLLPGAPIDLAMAPSDPDIGYVSVNGAVFATDDGGATWTPRPPLQSQPALNEGSTCCNLPFAHALAVDPRDPRTVFATTNQFLVRSDDGTTTWRDVEPATPDHTRGPYLDLLGTNGIRLLTTQQTLFDSPVKALHRYDEVADTREETVLPAEPVMLGAPLDAVWHPVRDELLLATWDNNVSRFDVVTLYLLNPDTGQLLDVDELGLSPLLGVDVDEAGGYHVHNLDELVTLRVAEDGAAEQISGPIIRIEIPPFDPPEPPAPEPARLTPPATTVAVDPGDEVEVDYRLELPATPTPLDVFFLLDTSMSTHPYIEGLAQGLAGISRSLTGAGIDAQFGLGEYQDTGGIRYRLRSDIRPPDEIFQLALATIELRGGREPGYTALHQMATGEGISDPSTGEPVPAGQDATWRADSLRVAVVIADEEFAPDPDGPDRDRTIDSLVETDVLAFGVQYEPPPRPASDGLSMGGDPDCPAIVAAATPKDRALQCQMLDLAAATGALAPDGGIDCDGDGRNDVGEGEPLYCGVEDDGSGIAEIEGPLATVLASLTDEQPVELRVLDDGGADVAVATDADDTQVDVKSDHVDDDALGFTATFGCSEDQQDERLEVELAAMVGERSVATATALVECGVLAAPPPGGEQPVEEPPAGGHDAADQTGAPGAAPGSGPPAPAPAGSPGQASAPASSPAPGNAGAPAQSPAPGQAVAPAPTPGQAGAAATATPVDSGQAAVAPSTQPVSASPVVGAATPAPEQDQARLAHAHATRSLHFSDVRHRLEPPPAFLPTAGALAVGGLGLALALGGRRRPMTATSNVAQRRRPRQR